MQHHLDVPCIEAHMTSTTLTLPALPIHLSLDEIELGLSRTLVECVSAEGFFPQTFEVEHDGKCWQVEIRVKPEDGSLESQCAEGRVE